MKTCDYCDEPLTSGRSKDFCSSECRRESLTYTPIEDRLATPRNKIMRALCWLDWSTVPEIFERASIDEDPNSKERKAAYQTVARLVAEGVLIKRATKIGQRHHHDYLLSDTGRIEAKQIQRGEAPSRKRRDYTRAA